MKSFAAGGATAIARGGRVSVVQVGVDAFGNTVGESLRGVLQGADEQERAANNRTLLNASNVAADPDYYSTAANQGSNSDGQSQFNNRSIRDIEDEFGLGFTAKSGFGSSEAAFRRAANSAEQAGVAGQKYLDSLYSQTILGKGKDPRTDLARFGGATAGVIDTLSILGTLNDYANAFSTPNALAAVFGDENAKQLIGDASIGGAKLLLGSIAGAANLAKSVTDGRIGPQIEQLIGNLGAETPEIRASAARTATVIALGVALGGEGGTSAIFGALERVGGVAVEGLGSAASGFRTRIRSYLEKNPDAITPIELDRLLSESTLDSEALRIKLSKTGNFSQTPIDSNSLILDNNIASALSRSLNGKPFGSFQIGGERNSLIKLSEINKTDYRIPDEVAKELGNNTFLNKGIILDVDRTSATYQDLFKKLEGANVGGGKGAADRSIVADAFFAKGDTPTFITADGNIYRKLYTLDGGDLRKVGGLLPDKFPDGFNVLLNNRTLKVIPVKGKP